ncbi:MAG: hypothetical protein IH991_18575 [Planctomycetes bacterium]|nr:hypothetical protein [Planctomycetota bacterium]
MSVRSITVCVAIGIFATCITQSTFAQPGRPGAGRFIERIKAQDKNRDGKITKQEASGQLLQRFNRIDTNGDGVIDQAELKKLAERFRGGRPSGGRPSGGRPSFGGGAEAGKAAPDFTLKSVDGKQTVKLSSFAGKKPVALIFGSYT